MPRVAAAFVALLAFSILTSAQAAPVVTSITPTSGPTSGGGLLQIAGTGFGATGTVAIGSGSCATTAYSNTSISCTIPAGEGAGLAVTVTNSAGTSNAVPFSYLPPTITSRIPTTGSTSGGFLLTLSGTNFGTTGAVTVGGIACSTVSWTHTQVQCVVPAGQGAGVPVVLTTGGQSASTTFDYDAPIVTSVSPSVAPTAGGVTLTLGGFNFGLSGSVTVGGTNCPIVGWSHTNVSCTLPAGMGTGVPIVLTSAGRTATATIDYGAPAITSIVPATGNTAGGYLLTIAGSNFGTTGTVTVGGNTCTPVAWTHTQVRCMVPAGQGTGAAVVLTSAGRTATTTFDYDAPVISSISPSTGPTVGGVTLTLNGADFGLSGTVTVDGNACAITFYSHTQVRCTLPAGAGAGLSVVLTSAGRSASTTFSYDAPVITSVSPTTGPTSGGITLTLVGNNFGPTGIVTVGGSNCAVIAWTHTRVDCTLPAGMGTSVPIVLTSAGRTAMATFDYGAPSITAIVPATGPTTGGFTLTLAGTNFGTTGTVTVGGSACAITSWSHTQVRCLMPPGEGTGVSVVLTSAGQTASTTFDYDAPVITAVSPANPPTAGGVTLTLSGNNFGSTGTVTVGGVDCPAVTWSHTRVDCTLPAGMGTGVPIVLTSAGRTAMSTLDYGAPSITSITPTSGPTAGGSLITLTGSNFGTTGSVSLGGAACAVTSWSHTQVRCVLPAGEGTAIPVVLTSAGRTASTSFDYDGPVINGVSSPTAPTTGGVPLTIQGANFGLTGMVTVGGATCTVTSYSHTQIVCTLPPGQGAAAAVIVTARSGSAMTTFAYDPPAITSVAPSHGPTLGGTVVTIDGANFGTSGFVTIGGMPCTPSSYSHTQIVCTSPTGVGAGVALVVASGGQTASATWRYDAPVITSVTPSSGPSAGGVTITVDGSNFGTAGSVTVGGATCAITMYSQTQIQCALPSGSGTGVPVVVTVAGQTSNTATFDYVGSDGVACASNSDCFNGHCVDGVCCDSACGGGDANDCMACSVSAGAARDGTCGARVDGTGCNDGNACTRTDQCIAGTCTGSSPVVCMPTAACHSIGTCDPSDGRCSDPLLVDGTPCIGGTCSAGACVPEPDAGDAADDATDASDATDVADADDVVEADESDVATDDGVDAETADASDAESDVAIDVVVADASPDSEADAAIVDSGAADAADVAHDVAADVTVDAARTDVADASDGGIGSESTMRPAGCGCRTPGGAARDGRSLALVAGVVAIALARRRRRRAA